MDVKDWCEIHEALQKCKKVISRCELTKFLSVEIYQETSLKPFEVKSSVIAGILCYSKDMYKVFEALKSCFDVRTYAHKGTTGFWIGVETQGILYYSSADAGTYARFCKETRR